MAGLAEQVNIDPSAVRPMTPVSRLDLTEKDALNLRSLAERAISDPPGMPLDSQLARFAVLCHELPEAIREALVDLRLSDTRSGGLVLSGLPVCDDELGETPSSSTTHASPELTTADAMLLLIASLMGDPISHAEIEDGRLIRDVRPMRGDELTQLGSSSTGELAWHIEDAFHDLRADWLFLLCLRNPSRAATSFARLQDVAISDETRSVLFEERFLVSPDTSHLDGATRPADRRIAVLSGDPHAPFVRVDPAFMPTLVDDQEAADALSSLIDAIDRSMQDVVLDPGDLFVVDKPSRSPRAPPIRSQLRRSGSLATGRARRRRSPQVGRQTHRPARPRPRRAGLILALLRLGGRVPQFLELENTTLDSVSIEDETSRQSGRLFSTGNWRRYVRHLAIEDDEVRDKSIRRNRLGAQQSGLNTHAALGGQNPLNLGVAHELG